MKILVINPGSTSTKIAIYEEEEPIYSESISHSAQELAPFSCVLDQLEYRKGMVQAALDRAGYAIRDFDAVSARGGFTKPVRAGTYRIDENVIYATAHPRYEHAGNLGSQLAWALTRGTEVPCYFVDPVSVDEITDVARITGMYGMKRECFFHALNHRGMARKAAAQLGKKYEDCNFIVSHLGGGVTTAAHQHGRAVEVCNVFEEGCFSMDRGGALPPHQVVELCFSGKSKEEIIKMLDTNGGVVSYLGTRDFRDVERRAFAENDAEARLIFEAMAYQLAKDIGAMAAVLHFDVDGIILTGGMAYSERFTDTVASYVRKIAPIILLPGEAEMLSLAQGALRVLKGEEPARTF